jgi:hypothetical protein
MQEIGKQTMAVRIAASAVVRNAREAGGCVMRRMKDLQVAVITVYMINEDECFGNI